MATSAITNTITDPAGTAVASVRVVAKLMPTAGFRVDTGAEVARIVEATSNSSGVWTLNLERAANITPANTTYEVTEHIPDASGGKRVWNISVGASNQSVSAALVTPLAAQTATYLTQASADARYQQIGALGGTPVTILPDSAGSNGVATAAARSDHDHPITAAVPVDATASALAEGAATTFSRADHAHRGGTAPVANAAARPASPYTGQTIHQADEDRLYVYNGTDWAPYAAGGMLEGGYAQVTAAQAGITSITDLTSLTVTVTVATARRIRITMDAEVSRTVVDGSSVLSIRESSTTLHEATVSPNVANESAAVHRALILAPSAGSHTYKLSLARVTGTGTTGLAAASTKPASITVEDIGPA